jgi:hypothetical protein
MLAPDRKKKSSNRLSSLFNKASPPADSQDSNTARLRPATASEPGTRLSKVRNRLSSATHLAPQYPPPSQVAPRHVSLSAPTIQPVDTHTDFERLEPPPSLGGAGPGSRPSSRGSSPASSRPGTPNADAGAEGKLKKLRRKSGLFGGSQSTDGAAGAQDNEPLAWIVGHKGKVPYNLALLLSGEKVCRSRQVW